MNGKIQSHLYSNNLKTLGYDEVFFARVNLSRVRNSQSYCEGEKVYSCEKDKVRIQCPSGCLSIYYRKGYKQSQSCPIQDEAERVAVILIQDEAEISRIL